MGVAQSDQTDTVIWMTVHEIVMLLGVCVDCYAAWCQSIYIYIVKFAVLRRFCGMESAES